jgi:hypothetical protein
MGSLIRYAEIIIKILGFIIAEVVPFGRAIQELFKKKEK